MPLQEVGVVPLGVDTEAMMRDLESIDEKREEVDKAVEKTKKKTQETWMLAVGVAQSSWTLFETILSTSGVVISGFLRTAISSAFSAIAIIQPILAAEAVTPGMQAMAALGFFQIGLALTAAWEAERQAGGIDADITAASRQASSTSSWIRSLTSFGKNI